MMFLPDDDPRSEVGRACQSPIEEYLCCALFALAGCRAVRGKFNCSRLPELSANGPACFLFSQHVAGPYVADFLLVAVNPERHTSRQLIVECDGRAFHADIERDICRDADLRRRGYQVARFSGKDLFGDMLNVIRDLRKWIEADGVKCDTPDDLKAYTDMLLMVTPQRQVEDDRKSARDNARRDDAEDAEEYARLTLEREEGF